MIEPKLTGPALLLACAVGWVAVLVAYALINQDNTTTIVEPPKPVSYHR